MAIFTVPSDFKKESVKKFIEMNENLEIKATEFYGSIRTSKIGSGRKFLELENVELEQLKEYVQYCNRNGIKFNYTLNVSCNSDNEFTKEGKQELIDEITKLVNIGIKDFTVVLPSIISIFNEEFPDVDITLSIIAGVDTVSKMKYFCEYENIKNIYIHEKLYRQTKLMKELIDVAHKYNKKVGMIVNSICLSDCPFRDFHYAYVSHASKEKNCVIPEYYGTLCALEKIKDKRNVLSASWVRPDDLKFYIDLGIDRFKISGREMFANKANMHRVVEVFNKGEFEGNLIELFMCFTKCAYSEIFDIQNNKAVGNYITSILNEKIECHQNGCNNCNNCKEVLKEIKMNEANKAKWMKVYTERLRKFREL